jgi:hypothetical protein
MADNAAGPQDVLPLCRRLAGDLIREGAQAVVLTGSHARGTATPESDVDLLVIGTGTGPGYQLSVREDRLVAVSWCTGEQQRRRFASPRSAVTEIPGWRSAVIVTDPDGIAAALQREAADWTWDRVTGQAREWVAEELTGLAEEVHKLAAALRHGRPRMAAVQRDLLVLHLPMVLAVRFQLLCASENDLWDAIAVRAGEDWRASQDRALCLDRESLAGSCLAALELYRQAAGIAEPLPGDRQRGVVAGAVALAGEVLGAR